MFAKSQKDAEGEFLRNHNAMVRTSTGAVHVITAEGKTIGRGLGLARAQKALEAWEALPENERQPGAVKIGERGERDPRLLEMSPPEGCLILRATNRHMGQTVEGDIRYLLVDDFSSERAQRSAPRYREPSNDFMWIMKDEWQELLPESPKVGDRAPVPAPILARLLRYHLNPLLSVRGAMCFTGSSPGDGKLEVVVEEVSPERVRLRLEGSARLSHPIVDADDLVYEPAFLGYVEYDPSKRTISRFDMIALGDLDGALPNLSGRPMAGIPDGTRPFGIAFGLIADPSPAETIRPHGCSKRRSDYLNPSAE